ncbi:hypothetical protein [Butyrivibrio sp. MC2013]|uniref:hypothetical protein n=1 Tax=Butyrivibrio sp. MC2013 TaxID=1280686 RepID=UPI00047B76E7|nr:hypothetical protein [Butyrivibrio sp. MC2013]
MNRKFWKSIVCLVAVLLFTSCGLSSNDVSTRFIKEFELSTADKQITIDELYNSYGGVPYEGIALYKLEIDQNVFEEIQKWDALPYSDEVTDFIDSVSPSVDFPNIIKGYYKFINRGEDTNIIKNASLCVYDQDNGIAYYLLLDS